MTLLPRDPTPLRAECSECQDWRDSDPLTIDEALSDGWAVVDSQLVCPDHLTKCDYCGVHCLLERDGCCDNSTWHCLSCGLLCGRCGEHDRQEREPHDD
jgi:hypothetical protein